MLAKDARLWTFSENQLIDLLVADRHDFIYAFLEEKRSWEYDRIEASKRWLLKPRINILSHETRPRVLTDVDIFCFNRPNPLHSIAIECKKIKVRSDSRKDSVSKGLRAIIGDAAKQARRLLALGFPFVSILMVVSNDANNARKGGVLWDTMRYEKLDTIAALIESHAREFRVPERVGIYLIKLTENNERSIVQQGAGALIPIRYPSKNNIRKSNFKLILDDLNWFAGACPDVNRILYCEPSAIVPKHCLARQSLLRPSPPSLGSMKLQSYQWRAKK